VNRKQEKRELYHFAREVAKKQPSVQHAVENLKVQHGESEEWVIERREWIPIADFITAFANLGLTREDILEAADVLDGPYFGTGDGGVVLPELPEVCKACIADTVPAGEDEGGEEDEDSDSGSSSSSGDDAVSSANSKVQENKRKVREIEEKMTMLADDKLHHFGLVDKCISKRDAEYEYKLCFFKDAHQDHVSLGRWDDWTGPMTASFKHGAMCPGGPERSLNVIFECGVEDEITRLGEPSRCVYEAVVRTAGACDPAQLEIEKAEPKPRTPKDEL